MHVRPLRAEGERVRCGGRRDRRRGWDGEAGRWREAEDFEMRDVRRDGLIEALLIAFTPPRGLPYPRVYPPSLDGSAEAVSGERRASIFLPLRRPPARPRPYLLLPHHGLHHGVPFICT